MTKKKTTAKITVKEAEKVTAKSVPMRLRNVYNSKLVISESRTDSGQRYVFELGEVKAVHPLDYDLLLSLEQSAGGCCGGSAKPQKYFQEV